MDKFRNKYRNDSARLNTRDYGAAGLYFVTLITKNRKNYFGRIEFGTQIVSTQHFASLPDGHFVSVCLTEIGKIAHQYWMEIPNHFPFVALDEFIIMPNHIHRILSFNKSGYSGKGINTFGPQSQNLASVIRGFKAATKKYATLNSLEFAWQPRYHDRVVRLDEIMTTRRYIKNNPAKWIKDQDHVMTQDLASQEDGRTQNLASQHARI